MDEIKALSGMHRLMLFGAAMAQPDAAGAKAVADGVAERDRRDVDSRSWQRDAALALPKLMSGLCDELLAVRAGHEARKAHDVPTVELLPTTLDIAL